jgi:hypothetical protein
VGDLGESSPHAEKIAVMRNRTGKRERMRVLR